VPRPTPKAAGGQRPRISQLGREALA
jgi:hypothetical protein